MDHNRDFWHKYFVNSFPVSNTACVKWLACKYKLCSHSLSCVLFKLHFTLNFILKLLHVIPGLFLNAKLSEYYVIPGVFLYAKLSEYCYASHTIFCKHRVSLIYIYSYIYSYSYSWSLFYVVELFDFNMFENQNWNNALFINWPIHTFCMSGQPKVIREILEPTFLFFFPNQNIVSPRILRINFLSISG